MCSLITCNNKYGHSYNEQENRRQKLTQVYLVHIFVCHSIICDCLLLINVRVCPTLKKGKFVTQWLPFLFVLFSRVTTMPWTQTTALVFPWDWGIRDTWSLETFRIYTSSMKSELCVNTGVGCNNKTTDVHICLWNVLHINFTCHSVFSQALQRYEEHPERVGECFIQFVSCDCTVYVMRSQTLHPD